MPTQQNAQTRKRLRQSTLNALANIPEGSEGKRSRKAAPINKGTWTESVKGLMLYEPNSWKDENGILLKSNPVKVAAFDLDSTLITTKSRVKFPKSPNDWRLMNARVQPKIAALAEEQYLIVIFTNQAGVSNGRINESFVKARLDGILGELKVDVGVFVATAKDNFRKPATGMWDLLVQMVGSTDRIDTQQSFYVGDAAGRKARPGHPADFSDSDLCFSINIGLPFRTPEQYFLGKAEEGVSPETFEGFDPRKLLEASGELHINDATDMNEIIKALVTPAQVAENLILGLSQDDELPNVQTMVLMHGFPASGKTTFAKRFLVPRGYIWVNHDSMHTFSRCLRTTRDGLASGKSVIVDNSNPDRKSRSKYIEAGKLYDPNLKIVSLTMDTPRCLAEHLNKMRERESMGAIPHVPIVAYHSFQKRRRLPEADENIDLIGEVKFRPSFTSENERYLFSRLS